MMMMKILRTILLNVVKILSLILPLFLIFLSFLLSVTDRWRDGRRDGWRNGWRDRWRDGQRDGQTKRIIEMRKPHLKTEVYSGSGLKTETFCLFAFDQVKYSFKYKKSTLLLSCFQ